MPQFDWFGRNASQDAVSGVLESPGRLQAAEVLAAQGIVPVTIEPHAEPVDARDTLRRLLGRQRVGDVELLLFTRQMHTLLRSGVPILRALRALQESATHSGLADLLDELRQALDSGHELSQALARHDDVFDAFFVAMVQVGESTGRLGEVFDALHRHLEFQRLMREQVAGALRYPKFVVAAMAVAISVINLFVIPAFAKVFDNLHAELPLMTRILIGGSNLFLDTWPVLLAALVGAVFVWRRAVATPRGRLWWDRWKLALPIAGKVLRKGALARACRSLALAMKSGVPALQGLQFAGAVTDNAYIEGAILGMRTAVEHGESVLAACRKAGIFTPIVLQMVMVGEETGRLDEMLDEVGALYQREVEYELKSMSQQIEPVLILVLGAMVLVLALGVFMPMWDLGRAALK
ncbi:MAG: Type II secretion system protein F [Burkholderiaceae bacterium]|nr:Type II secretion system protein F [Burkholderiaceae bacterium]